MFLYIFRRTSHNFRGISVRGFTADGILKETASGQIIPLRHVLVRQLVLHLQLMEAFGTHFMTSQLWWVGDLERQPSSPMHRPRLSFSRDDTAVFGFPMDVTDDGSL